jgi:hypothetical protein
MLGLCLWYAIYTALFGLQQPAEVLLSTLSSWGISQDLSLLIVGPVLALAGVLWDVVALPALVAITLHYGGTATALSPSASRWRRMLHRLLRMAGAQVPLAAFAAQRDGALWPDALALSSSVPAWRQSLSATELRRQHESEVAAAGRGSCLRRHTAFLVLGKTGVAAAFAALTLPHPAIATAAASATVGAVAPRVQA